jgi:hypothetical protein
MQQYIKYGSLVSPFTVTLITCQFAEDQYKLTFNKVMIMANIACSIVVEMLIVRELKQSETLVNTQNLIFISLLHHLKMWQSSNTWGRHK